MSQLPPPPAPEWVHTSHAQRVHFGAGTAAGLPGVLREIGARRVMLVTTPGRAESEEGERLAAGLGRALVARFTDVSSHVPVPTVRAAVEAARSEDLDAVVSLGGGSCADTAKAVCFFLEQERGMPGASYLDRPAVAHVSVPTTYSGAELTGGFGMTDQVTRTKQGAGSPTLVPVAVVYDPVLTLSTPAEVSAASGMNALAHGVEGAYSPRRSPEAEAVGLAGVHRLAARLPDVVDDPADLGARTAVLAGAALAGRCMQNASMGLHHGLAQLLGGRTGISHGLANALLLGPVLRFNLEALDPAVVARIGEALGDPEDPVGAVDRLRGRLGLPARLSEVGVTQEDLEAVAHASQSSPSVRANLRPVSEEDARMVLDRAWSGNIAG